MQSPDSKRKRKNGDMQYSKTEKVIHSNEKGFTGEPEEWFNDDEYYKNLPGKSDVYHEKDYYFNSYSTFYIHEEMIKDKVRTGTYKEAIEKNAEIFKDKIVLDVGCGTGILSIFAAKAGAKHVYGIEFADIADYAKEIVKLNHLEKQITIFKSKVEDVQLPVNKVDIIISEWMGYFLLYESMLDTVLFARDKWLDKENGYLFPDRARMYIASIEDNDYYYNSIEFWNIVHYFDYKCMRNTALAEPLIDVTKENMVNSNVCKIFDINLYNVQVSDLDYSAGFKLKIFRDDYVHGMCTWFDVGFEKCPHKVTLSTGPFNPSTHWKQTVFYLKKEKKVKKGDEITGDILVIKDKKNFRLIDVKIEYRFNEGNDKWMQMYVIY